MHKCINNSTANVYHLEQFVDNFFPYSQNQLRFDKPVTIRFEGDKDNAAVLLGKTAYYDPAELEIVLYIDNRHPKDIMRSLSHELVHHTQNCRGDFTNADDTIAGYAQSDPHLRKMEREAYTKGNLIFRDYEDLIKTGKIEVHIDFTESGEPKMSLKEWKNNEINTKLMKKWGLLKENKENLDERWATTARRGSTMPTIPLDDPEEKEKEKEKEELSEDSGEEESEHYGEDESANKREEDRLEDHLDAIEHHLKRLRDDMGFDQDREDDHVDEGAAHYRKDDEPEDVKRGDVELGSQEAGVNEAVSKKLSVKEVKELARRLIERIRKEGK